jgi:Ca-activated chloride channel family protein
MKVSRRALQGILFSLLVLLLAALPAAAGKTKGAKKGALSEKKRQAFIQKALAGIPQATEGEDKTLSPYFFVFSDNPETDLFPLKATSAKVDVSGVIADVKVSQTYANDGKNVLEAMYIFPLSSRAAVYAMTMTIGDRTIEAVIKEKEEAKAIYKKAIEAGKTASLLEQQRPNVFQMTVGNILPGDEIVVDIAYTELLVPEDGEYELVFPTVVGPRYSNKPAAGAPASDAWSQTPTLHEGQPSPFPFDIEVVLRSGIPVDRVESPSHDIAVDLSKPRAARVTLKDKSGAAAGTRDFILRYRLAGSGIQTGVLLYPGQSPKDEKFFLAMVEPPKKIEGAHVLPREVVFIMDVSGSMNGFPIEVSKKVLTDILSTLRPTDYYNVLLFAGGSAVLSESSLPATNENVARGTAFIDSQAGGGGTEILPALERALALPRVDGVSRTVVVATDGYVTVEKEAFELIRDNLGQANLFAFGIGTSVNRYIIEGMARVGMGEPFVVTKQDESEGAVKKFVDYMAAPLMMEVRVAWEGLDAYDIEPPFQPDLFAGRPVVVFGKYKGEAKGTVTVTGRTPSGDFKKTLDLGSALTSTANGALRYLWARRRIMALADYNQLEKTDARVKEITELGLAYNLMTEYTSFVAVDTEVRADGKKVVKVKQPVPLPEGVSDKAVGGGAMIGSQIGAAYGSGGMAMAGVGYGKGSGSLKMSYKAAAPKIASGTSMVTGSLSKEVIKKVMKQYSDKVRTCYEDELQKNPKLEGKVVVKLVISSTGAVTSVTIAESTLGSDAVEKCILAILKKAVFPAPEGGGTLVVTYPYIFKPQE